MQTIPFSYFLPQSGGIVICFYFDQKKNLRDSSIKLSVSINLVSILKEITPTDNCKGDFEVPSGIEPL